MRSSPQLVPARTAATPDDGASGWCESFDACSARLAAARDAVTWVHAVPYPFSFRRDNFRDTALTSTEAQQASARPIELSSVTRWRAFARTPTAGTLRCFFGATASMRSTGTKSSRSASRAIHRCVYEYLHPS